MISSFIGLHIHSDYSLLDGASQLPQLIDRALELGMSAIALTDHGVMYGAVELIKICRDRGIKPIIGNEMYVINGDITKQERRPRYHQVVLAKNTQGYKNLTKLTSISHLDGFQGKGIFARPCINKDLLAQYKEGLIVTSACLGGEIPQCILKKRPDKAREIAQWYKDTFSEDFYLEIQDHGMPEDRLVNVEIVRIAKDLDIKIVATNDSHYISCNDVEAHDALLCIQTGKLITEDKRLRYSGTEYLKSAEEMAQLFRDHLEDDIIQEAIANTLEVADKVQTYTIFGETRIPNFPIPAGYTADTYVEEETWKGILERFNAKTRAEIQPVYRERMEYELKIIQQMGFSTYFLVVWDYIKFARDRSIPVGPGRGSAAGSLVAYALRITNIDPVHHGLLFERFLNPERKSMPDIDTDFCIDRREEVIEYVTEKYGKERVAQIVTFNRMTSKAVLKDVARVLDIPYKQADKMAKMIPVSRGKPEKLKVMISDETPEPEFKAAYDNDPIVRHWLDMAMRIEGTNKSTGVHAAGVVISSDPLDEVVPLQLNKEGAVTTQYSMEELEMLGMLKMDFLGLKNLTMIQKTIDLIKQTKNLEIDPDQLPIDERKAQAIFARSEEKKMPGDIHKTYTILENGNLAGIFQLESSGMRQVVRDLKPSSIEDISSILALYRPGPLDAGLIPKFINRKHGREAVEVEHELLAPILNETYGVLCLPKGTLIDRPDGSYTPIENIQPGDSVLTSDGKQVRSAKVAKQWHSGIKDILKITLSSGTVLYSSTTHRFLTPEGDCLASQLKPALGSLKTAYIQGSTLYEKWSLASNRKTLQTNEAYLLGLLLGDGNLVSSTPNIACSTEEAAAWVSTVMSETWGGEAKYYFHTRCWYAYSKFNTAPNPTPLTQFLDKAYGSREWKVKAYDKHLPDDVTQYCEADRIDLLRGLWDSNGCYSAKHIYFRNTSAKLRQQVAWLLGSLKILHFVKHNSVYVADRQRFHSILGQPQLPNKLYAEQLDNNYLPILSALLLEDLAEAIAKTDSTTRKTVKRSLNQATLFRPKKSNYKENLGSWDDIYNNLYTSTYLQDARPVYVVSIEAMGQAECFDLQMEDQSSPYFLAHGVVTHNCYQEQIMKMAQDLAGYTLGEADLLRRAMGKKKVDEMQKHRTKFIDGSAKNGVRSAIANELFDQMLKFAEYCFNKSHSMAYGYVTYQTAYLKANYPVEYMAALLTANSDSQDKVQKYIATCMNMNIKVEPPNVNRSAVDFTPVSDRILFGLSAVRNLGQGAIECILKAREEGDFQSLADLCDRVELRTVNKKAMEALIKCGALDPIEPNRHQLINDLELVMDWAQSRAKDKASGQGNLFDFFGTTADKPTQDQGFESVPKSKPVPDYPDMEKLKFEKELLGFYVSNHPLQTLQKSAKLLAPVNLNELEDQRENATISAVVMLTSIKPILTKKGDRMAIVQLEDLTGQAEGVIFPKVYERISQAIVTDARLIIWGKIDQRDEQAQLIIEDAEPIDRVQMVVVKLTPQTAGMIEEQYRLKEILLEQIGEHKSAKVPVVGSINSGLRQQFVRFGNQFRVPDATLAVNALNYAGFRAIAKPLAPS
jgi:DNA polymerase-3 subunit alpha